jgi:hypothetical protein
VSCHGVVFGATGGGLSPVLLTEVLSVTVVVPPGLVALVSDLTLLSSEQPASPMPNPAIMTPAIVALMNFLMSLASVLGIPAASDLA